MGEERQETEDDQESQEILVGTGSYLVQIRLKCQIPNVIPMQGKKIKIWYPGVKVQCRWCYGYHKKEVKCEKKLSFPDYISEFKTTNQNLPDNMYSLEAGEHSEPENDDKDIYSFLDDLEEEEEGGINDNHNIINKDNNNNNEDLTEDKVENWTVDDMEKFLLTFIPTEEESSWIKTATKNIQGETESEVLPYFKAIVKKRLVSRSGCSGPK